MIEIGPNLSSVLYIFGVAAVVWASWHGVVKLIKTLEVDSEKN